MSEPPFYWTAPSHRRCDCARDGWYQWTERGLQYLGASILDREQSVSRAGPQTEGNELSSGDEAQPKKDVKC